MLNKDSILLKGVHGAIGKKMIVKQYAGKTVITKYPVRSANQPNPGQLKKYELFRDAVRYAKELCADPERKYAWQSKLPPYKSVYNQVIRQYMKIAGNKEHQASMLAHYAKGQGFDNIPVYEMKQLLLLHQLL